MPYVVCPLCRKDVEVAEEAPLPKSCPLCEYEFPQVCPECLTVNDEEASWCGHCGADL